MTERIPLRDRILGWFGRRPKHVHSGPAVVRGRMDHVIILDGTMSSLAPGQETNAGLTYKLLRGTGNGAHLSIMYEAGLQWRDWKSTYDVLTGRGINRQIQRAYGALASRYRPGDRIFLIGYSRGAYAVRSLAGVIDKVGLVRAEQATARNIRQAYRHYQDGPETHGARTFAEVYCHADVMIEMVGVWDTVKALGLRVPFFWRYNDVKHAFHNHHLGPSVRHGYHALAMDETREAYAPVMWICPDGWVGDMEQVWFRGTHGDIGGQIDGIEVSRPLANIPLVWMLERIERCGIALPAGWATAFPCDPAAPSIGRWQGWGKLFLSRKRRIIGLDRSESIHPTAAKATLPRASGRIAGAFGPKSM